VNSSGVALERRAALMWPSMHHRALGHVGDRHGDDLLGTRIERALGEDRLERE
jgi:hypothetical protein